MCLPFAKVPLCLVRDLKVYAPFNSVANFLIGSSLIIITWVSVARISAQGPAPSSTALVTDSSWYLFVGSSLFAFEGIPCVLPIAESLSPKDRPRFLTVYVVTILVIGAGEWASIVKKNWHFNQVIKKKKKIPVPNYTSLHFASLRRQVYLSYSIVAYLSFGAKVNIIVTLNLGDNIFPAAAVRCMCKYILLRIYYV